MPLRLFHAFGGEEPRSNDLPNEGRTTSSSGASRVLRLLGAASRDLADDIDSSNTPSPHRGRWTAVRGLIFDMGDVLFDATAWRRRLLQLLARMGLHANYRSLFDLWDCDYLDAVHCGRRDYAEAFVTFLRDAGLTPAQVDEVVVASNVVKREIESEVRLYPLVRETLTQLHARGLPLAILSDSESPAAAIRTRLDGLGVGPLFSEIASSVDLGCTKPDPRSYQTVLERLSLKAEEAAFVGHDVDELRGARRCGLATIAFNADRGATADYRLRRFDDLLRLVSHVAATDAAARKAA